MRKITFLSLIASVLFHSIAFAGNPVTEYKLDNGLTIWVKEDHRAPVVLSEVWYKVGSSYEPNGTTGVSHALEHMMFKGTQAYPNGVLLKMVAENGGEQNAFTYLDFTAYYEEFSADKLALSFQLEADRMRNLNLNADDFSREIKVVQEERKMRIDNDPEGKTSERFNAAAFISNPYHHPVIGWPSDLENMTVEDLRNWYKTWYAPNNAYLVVVGDVKPADVYTLAKKYFGPLKPSVLPVIKPHETYPSLGERRLTVNAPAKLPLLMMGYNTPSAITLDNNDPYALEVLAALLGGTNSSRFQQDLVRGKAIAASMSADYDLYSRLPGLLSVSAIPAQGVSTADLEKAVTEEVNKLKKTPVTQAELDRIKNQVVAGNIYSQDSLSTQAYLLGSFATVGKDWLEVDNYVEQVKKVTPADIQRVANKYLVEDSLTVATLKPLPIKDENVAPVELKGDSHVQ